MNKKIVLSSNTSWSIYNFRLNLARALKKQGYKVIIVAPYDEYSEKLKNEFKYYNIYINSKGTNPLEDIKTIITYYRLYKKIKPDLIINYTIKPNIYGSIGAHLNKIPHIAVITGLGYSFVRRSMLTTFIKYLYKISLKNSHKIFFLNKDDVRVFIEEGIVREEKIVILPGEGIDASKFKPIEIKKEDNKFRFLLIARMIWDKGIKEYVEASKIIKSKYSNVEFLLLGPLGVNNPTAISEGTIQEWQNQGLIKYLGTRDDVKYEIAKADCVVLPSYREGISRVLLESASMEKPIITTEVPGCKEIVNDSINGFLCKPKDSNDLADKMEKMLKLNEEERKKMGMAGRMKVLKQFDEKIVINKYLETIRTIVGN